MNWHNVAADEQQAMEEAAYWHCIADIKGLVRDFTAAQVWHDLDTATKDAIRDVVKKELVE